MLLRGCCLLERHRLQALCPAFSLPGGTTQPIFTRLTSEIPPHPPPPPHYATHTHSIHTTTTATTQLTRVQDFTILILLGAGCLSLLLEFVVNRRTNGEGSWIEGASILAAGWQAVPSVHRGTGAPWLRCDASLLFHPSLLWAVSPAARGLCVQPALGVLVTEATQQPALAAKQGLYKSCGRARVSAHRRGHEWRNLRHPTVLMLCSWRGGARLGGEQLPEGAAIPHAAGGIGRRQGVPCCSPRALVAWRPGCLLHVVHAWLAAGAGRCACQRQCRLFCMILGCVRRGSCGSGGVCSWIYRATPIRQG